MTTTALEAQQKADVYTTLKLFEAFLSLCFDVVNMKVLSTEADDLYVYLEMREALVGHLSQIEPLLPRSLPSAMLPETISSMSKAEYRKLQIGFGIVKAYAKAVKAHGSEVDTEASVFIKHVESLQNGERLKTDVSLAASDISEFTYSTQSVNINGIQVHLAGVLEVYFTWAMFQKAKDVYFSWDEILEDIESEYRDKHAFKNGSHSMNQAMHRVNRTIKATVGTKDLFFTHKSGGFKRNFGPDVE